MNKWSEHDYPENFDKLSSDQQEKLIQWIKENIQPRKTFNTRHTSYGLKHLVKFSDEPHPYFDNGEFKGAMLNAGFEVMDKSELNWVFNVSQKSLCFKVT